LEIFLDIIVVFAFAFSSRIFWELHKRKKTTSLKNLFKAISLFIVFHFIVFPIGYVILIHGNTNSIRIEENIIRNEKEIKLTEAYKSNEEYDSLNQRENQNNVIQEILSLENDSLHRIEWAAIDNKKLIILDSFFIKGYTQGRNIPSDVVHKVITIYDKNGNKIVETITYSKSSTLAIVLTDILKEIDVEKRNFHKRIKKIESDKFWSYRQILPYTMNILFTDNFIPHNKVANVIYFIHSLVIGIFLLTFMASLYQNYIVSKK